MTQAAAPAIPGAPKHARHLLEPQQIILLTVLVLELITFGIFGTRFLTSENFFKVSLQSVELGLLALAMTPVIVTGGIDLSVGSMMGLAAVLFGKLTQIEHVPVGVAVPIVLVIGMVGGWINAFVITRINIPPLIVTLGTYSLYRGIAEGITGGFKTYTDFPGWFQALGQGWQLPILLAAVIAFYLLLHRSTFGRALVAIGFSPQGAAHAGIPVKRRIATAYILAGFCAALAAVIYCARIDQAKSDVGTGYELSAITAVVLGGTSIFGGRGSIIGTIMGLFAIALLENGLRLSAQRAEMAEILKGILLLAAIGADWRPSQTRTVQTTANEELNMRNSQLTVLCAVILLAALIVHIGDYMLVQGLKSTGTQASTTGGPSPQPMPAGAKQYTIAMMPKATGNAYFINCKVGADEAAKELGVKLLWDGPADNDPAKQSDIVDTWITRGVDAIAVSVDNKGALDGALRRAKAKGIKIVTYDADADTDARDFFVNQATAKGIGETLMDDAAATMGGSGDFVIITATLTAANQQEWIKYIKERLASTYPNIHLAEDPLPCDDQQAKATDQAKTVLASLPNVKMIMAICTPGVPGAAEAVKQSGRNDVHVVGLGLPNENKPYVKSGITTDVVLWNTMDLGYLSVYSAYMDAAGTLKAGDKSFQAGKLGTINLDGDNVMLGKPYSFTKDNIDNFNF